MTLIKHVSCSTTTTRSYWTEGFRPIASSKIKTKYEKEGPREALDLSGSGKWEEEVGGGRGGGERVAWLGKRNIKVKRGYIALTVTLMNQGIRILCS